MKKGILLLLLWVAIVSYGFAQDTITGVVSRVAAPNFEQNVCDSRFAIMSEGETYYVMVDGYWPNPYLESLVLHYDTIPVGNEIEVVGTTMEMVDGQGRHFKTIDISKNLSSNHREILGFFGYSNVVYPNPDTISAAMFYHFNGMDGYYITINGELQTNDPFIINGRTLVWNKRYLFIGCSDTLTDYYGNTFNVFELVDALPYDKEDFNINGTLTTENDLCLLPPCGETRFLSLFDGEGYRYLTNKGKLKNNYINDAVFNEGDSVVIGGFELICHDIFGAPFTAFEFIKVQSYAEHLLIGGVGSAPIPYIGIGPPLPGVDMAFFSDNIDYYIRNPHDGDGFYGSYVVGNDTVQATMQQLRATLVAGVFIHNYLHPCYTVYINNVEFEEHEETLECTLAIANNPFYWGNTLVVTTVNNDTCFLKPYLYTNTPPNHISVGNHTVYVGDSFTATGMVSHWYYNQYWLGKVIDITSIGIVDVQESCSPEIQIIPNPSNGIMKILSDQPIKSVSVCDYLGQPLLFDYHDSNQIVLDLHGFKGVALICVFFEDGHKTIKKTIIR